MQKKFKVILVVISWIVFLTVIFTVEYPTTLANASFFQLAAFFTPLFAAIFFTLNIFAKSVIRTLVISFVIMLLLVLQGFSALNPVTFTIALIAVYLLLGSFKNNH